MTAVQHTTIPVLDRYISTTLPGSRRNTSSTPRFAPGTWSVAVWPARELGPDPLGDALAALARYSFPRIPLESHWGAVPARLLNYSVPSAFSSLFYRAVDAWKEKHRLA